MIEQKIKLASESLARAMDRRTFLQRTGSTVFAGFAALAAGHVLARGASATSAGKKPLLTPLCTPPGPYCNLDGNGSDPNGCMGGRCFQHLYSGTVYQCRVYYTYYPAGCWTRALPSGGYWTCCDCECGEPRVATCGCAQFSQLPVPNPDSPTGTPSK
jgi:hypothetical protein